MQVRTGVGVLFAAQFTESKVGKTGLTVTVNVYLVNTSGTASAVVTGGSATEVGKGVYSYLLSSGSNTTAGVLVATFLTATTSVDQQEIPAAWGIELPAPAAIKSLDADVITAASIAASAIGTSEAPALADIAAIKAKTDNLPADPADASDIASAFSTVTAALTTIAGYIDTEIGAILSAVDTEVASIKAKTDNLPSDTAASLTAIASSLTTLSGYVDTEVAAILAAVDTEVAAIKAKTDGLPASPAATSDIPGAAAVAAAVIAATVEGSLDLGEVLRVVLAACAGKADGLAGTTAHYRDQADTKNRITATVDEHGNRTAITLDPS